MGGEKLGGGGGGGCAASPTASTKMVGGSGGVPLSAHLTRVLKTLRRGDADGGRGRCAGLHGGGDRGERGLPVVRGDEQREIMRLSTRMRGEGSRERSTLYYYYKTDRASEAILAALAAAASSAQATASSTRSRQAACAQRTRRAPAPIFLSPFIHPLHQLGQRAGRQTADGVTRREARPYLAAGSVTA